MSDATIETTRLVLRPPRAEDRAALHAIWADPLVMRDLGPVKSPADSDAALARHDGYRAEGLGFHAVIRRTDRAVIGFCGLKRGHAGTPIAGELEAGWVLARTAWGQGYAVEAMRAALAWGWANTPAPRIVAITAQRNVNSRRMMDRLGFHHRRDEDFAHPDFAHDDALRETAVYALDRPR